MTKVLSIIFLLFTLCNGQNNEISTVQNKDNTSEPYHLSDHGLRITASTTSTLSDDYENLNIFEVSYIALRKTKYNYDVFTSVGLMQEYGYSLWRSHGESYHFIFGKIGIETGFFNQLYIDLYFGGYLSIYPYLLVGARARYNIQISELIKFDIGFGYNTGPEKYKMFNVYLGLYLF